MADEDIEELVEEAADELMAELEAFLSVMKPWLRVPRCGPTAQCARTVVSISERRLTCFTFMKRSTP